MVANFAKNSYVIAGQGCLNNVRTAVDLQGSDIDEGKMRHRQVPAELQRNPYPRHDR